MDRRGLSIRCLPELIKALDEADNPPVSDEEVWEWVERWRKVEKSLYNDPNEARRGAAYITPEEIRSIVRTWRYRHGEDRHYTHYRQGVCRVIRYSPTPARLNERFVLGIGMASVHRWGMQKYQSVDIEEHDDRFLLHFRPNQNGARVFNRHGYGMYAIRDRRFRVLWQRGKWYKIEHLKNDDFVVPKKPLKGDGYVAGETS